jgi:hypothetical protein
MKIIQNLYMINKNKKNNKLYMISNKNNNKICKILYNNKNKKNN